jgi:hypothetical protein
MPAYQVLVVLLITLGLWTLLYAPELERAAETHPDGTRRDVSLAVVGPLTWFAETSRLASVTDAAGRLAGRDPDAALGAGADVIVDPLPPAPSEPGGKSP